MNDIFLALTHLFKDLFTQPRTNIVGFYIDGAGEPIFSGCDFQVAESQEFLEEFFKEFPKEEFRVWLEKSKLNHKSSREYLLTYSVDWKGKVFMRRFSGTKDS